MCKKTEDEPLKKEMTEDVNDNFLEGKDTADISKILPNFVRLVELSAKKKNMES